MHHLPRQQHFTDLPLQIDRKHQSLQHDEKKKGFEVVSICRSSSIHHLRKSSKPIIKQSMTYVEAHLVSKR